MRDPLATYLNDHLAGANFAVELLKLLRDQHGGEPLGAAAAELLVAIQDDRRVLQEIIDRVGDGSAVLKQAAAWLSEKMTESKFRRGAFGTFEALEALALGILGKIALWRALAIVAELNARVPALDFQQLAARATEQHARVEELRMQVARGAFAPVAR